MTFLQLGEKYLEMYLSGKLTEQMIVKFKSIRECLYECYLTFIKTKQITRIEAMDEKSKNELWDECKKYCEPLSNNERIRFVKAYRALCWLAENKL